MLFITLLVSMLEAALGAVVASRAWSARPGRLFVLLILTLIPLTIVPVLRVNTADTDSIYAYTGLVRLAMAAFDLVMLWLLSALFVPQWWAKRQVLAAISLPYILTSLVLAADIIGRLGLIVNGIIPKEGDYTFTTVKPGSSIVLGLFIISWVPHLAILVRTFWQVPAARRAIGALAAALMFTIVEGTVQAFLEINNPAAGALRVIPLIVALAYVVLFTHVVVPLPTAFERVLQVMREAVVVLTGDGRVRYANPQAHVLGIAPQDGALPLGPESIPIPAAIGTLIAQAVKGATITTSVMIGAQTLEVAVVPIVDQRGQRSGLLLLGRDVTDARQQTSELEQERSRLAETVRLLEAEQGARRQLSATVRGLSLPLIPILKRVMVLPIIGTFDRARSEEFSQVLLAGIARENARLVFIDITGMTVGDEDSTAALVEGVRAARLLGTRCVLVGIRPELAQTLLGMGLELDSFEVAPTLQQAVERELRLRPEHA
jgi:anti-anti-sigma regulatory factor/PAS domain-containing protein